MIVFTKDTQYNQCRREDILNFQNQKYINSLKHELKTGKGLINTALPTYLKCICLFLIQ